MSLDKSEQFKQSAKREIRGIRTPDNITAIGLGPCCSCFPLLPDMAFCFSVYDVGIRCTTPPALAVCLGCIIFSIKFLFFKYSKKIWSLCCSAVCLNLKRIVLQSAHEVVAGSNETYIASLHLLHNAMTWTATKD